MKNSRIQGNVGLGSAIAYYSSIGCNKATVFKYLNHNNIKPNKNKKRPNRKILPTINEILDMHDISKIAIAKHFGVSRQTIYNILAANNKN